MDINELTDALERLAKGLREIKAQNEEAQREAEKPRPTVSEASKVVATCYAKSVGYTDGRRFRKLKRR